MNGDLRPGDKQKTGTSSSEPLRRASRTSGPLFYDPSSQRFNLMVSPGTGRVASVLLTTP
jgi:hypothetical protein